VLLLGAVACSFWAPGQDYAALEAAFWRVGAVMAVFWLAYDDLRRLPPWLLGALPFVLFIFAFKPRWFVFILPVLIVLAVVWPRKRGQGTGARGRG
jgi:hypothetical protein